MPARNYGYAESQRRGRVFTLRLEPDEESTLRARMKATSPFSFSGYGRRASLGSFIVKMALEGSRQLSIPEAKPAKKKARR
jgi:hypothetical protein